jgi:hypothetical protein
MPETAEAFLKLDQNPVFRKIIVPWYDATPVCLLAIVTLLALALFGMMGMAIALEDAAYRNMAWVPLLITVLSLLVVILITRRLVMRVIHRRLPEQ